MRWRCLGNGKDQLGNEDEAVTNPKPYDIPKRRVLEAYWKVKAKQGAAGIDDESIEMFEADLTGNLYKLWNRISSGSYFPPPVKQVEIPKKDKGVRILGVPTVADRATGRCLEDRRRPLWGLSPRLARVPAWKVGRECGSQYPQAMLGVRLDCRI